MSNSVKIILLLKDAWKEVPGRKWSYWKVLLIVAVPIVAVYIVGSSLLLNIYNYTTLKYNLGFVFLQLLAAIITTPLFAGVWLVIYKQVTGQSSRISDLFKPMKRLAPLSVVALLLFVFSIFNGSLASLSALKDQWAPASSMGLSSVLLIAAVACFLLPMLYMFAIPLIVVSKENNWKVLAQTRAILFKHFVSWLLLLLLVSLGAYFPVILVLIGFVVWALLSGVSSLDTVGGIATLGGILMLVTTLAQIVWSVWAIPWSMNAYGKYFVRVFGKGGSTAQQAHSRGGFEIAIILIALVGTAWIYHFTEKAYPVSQIRATRIAAFVIQDDNLKKAVVLAANKGDATAQLTLGTAVSLLGNNESPAVGLQWLIKAAEQGDASAQYQLSSLYLDDNYPYKNYKEGVKWLRLAIKNGVAPAYNDLGVSYGKGQGVPKDRKKALSYYKMGVKYNDPLAMYNYGLATFRDTNNAEEIQEGLAYLEKAASRDILCASFELGKAYASGKKVPEDREKAQSAFSKNLQDVLYSDNSDRTVIELIQNFPLKQSDRDKLDELYATYMLQQYSKGAKGKKKALKQEYYSDLFEKIRQRFKERC